MLWKINKLRKVSSCKIKFHVQLQSSTPHITISATVFPVTGKKVAIVPNLRNLETQRSFAVYEAEGINWTSSGPTDVQGFLLRSYHQRGWASAAEPSLPIRSLPKGPNFSWASWSPTIGVSWVVSAVLLGAESHARICVPYEQSAVSPLSFSPRLPSRICGVNLRKKTNAVGARRLNVACSTHPCDFV